MKVGSFGFYNGKDLVLINEINDNYVIAISCSRHSFKIPITSSFYEIDQDSLKNIYNDYYNSNNRDLNFSFCHSSKRAFVKFKYNYHYDADVTIDNNLNIIDEFSKKYQTKFYKAIAYKYHILNKFNNYNIYYYSTINSYINLLKEIIKNYNDIELINANKDVNCFLISLKAGGVGLNLYGADTVIHLDLWWNVAAENQASDRAHRIGQVRNVEVIKLISLDTIEQKIIELQNHKLDLFNKLIDNDFKIENLSIEDLNFILN